MKIILILVLFCAFACQKKNSSPKTDDLQSSYSSKPETRYRNYGDYILEVENEISAMASTGFQAYNSVAWKNGVVPVNFKDSISKARQAQFFIACQEWSKAANIQCRYKKPTDKSYVFITDDKPKECWTHLGAGASGGERTFNYGSEGCWGDPAIIHEVGHILGLMHEHQRPDRDKYIDVVLENAGAFAYTYEKLSVGRMDNSGPYDFMSIMHYWNGSYSINGLPIMVPKKGYEHYAQAMGRSKTLTENDKALIRKIYGKSKIK